MNKNEYNKYRQIKSNLHKQFDIWQLAKDGCRLTLDIEAGYSTELKVKIDGLYKSLGFYPYSIVRSYEFTDMNARIIYIHFDSEAEYISLSTVIERTTFDNALYDGFSFDVCKYRHNVRIWEKSK